MRGWLVRRLGRRDDGRAIIEFVFLGVLLLVPMIYLVIVLARVQSAAFAVSTASREAGRAFTTAAGCRIRPRAGGCGSRPALRGLRLRR